MAKLVCPKCEAQSDFDISTSESTGSYKCPQCKVDFISKAVQIRAKNSRGSKKENRRQFSIRVIEFSGRESLIEFVKAGYDDFELRSKDIAVFSYLNGELKVVQNFSINQYMKVSKPMCYLATYAYGATSEEVVTLRHFRDAILLNSFILSWVVLAYYHISPYLVRRFGNNAFFRHLVIATLTPIIWVIRYHSDKPDVHGRQN